ncbi:hypothetical protein [Thalassotalea sediminis]|uniref:hypothetical protein n=1 Tax=Thalassotalea sediminis TaxID=1759089 RepID=UPI002572E8D5|nr:hypothetical protein [Thalassotalea sediminis]
MLHSLSKSLVIVTLLFVFLGQTMVSTSMACEMSMNTDMQNLHHTNVVNQKHDMHGSMSLAMQDHAEHHAKMPKDADCCKIDCHCPMSACSSLLFIGANQFTSPRISVGEPMVSATLTLPVSIIAALYRPPIFA